MVQPPKPSGDALADVLATLKLLRAEEIWPNGSRYLWTDAFGVLLLLSLYRSLGDDRYLREAEWVVSEVDRVLGGGRGLRIGEGEDQDGQYYHYLAVWLYALGRLGRVDRRYHDRAIELVREIHPAFVSDEGVVWKMKGDLSAPYPGYGWGAIDPFHGYVVYRLLDEHELASEIEDVGRLVRATYEELLVQQDLGLGMMLWLTHFFPDEGWARLQRARSLAVLDQLWVDPPGYFCRLPGYETVKYAFTNYGIAIGLGAVREWTDRAWLLQEFFRYFRSGDEYDRDPITAVMRCCALYPGELLVQRWKS